MYNPIHLPSGLVTMAILHLAIPAVHGQIIFQASSSNITEISNGAGNNDALTVIGDTNGDTLLLFNENDAFNSAGIASIDTIEDLNGSALTSTSAVTMTLTVDGITGAIRANGVTFGVTNDNTTFGDATDLRIQVRAEDQTFCLTSGFGTPDIITAWAATEASILDGFTVTLTADANGYAFSFSGLIAATANPIVDITGSFSGNEFLDNFNSGFLYQTTQMFNLGTVTTTTISEASIEVGSASIITWTAQEFDEESDLSTEGTLVFADNFQGEDAIVNGIPFIGRVTDNATADFFSPQFQTSQDRVSTGINLTGLYDGEVPALAPLLTDFWFSNAPGRELFTITNLTPGTSYLVEFGQADDRGGNLIGRYRQVDAFGGGAEGDPIGATNLTYAGPNNPAILVTGTFTATDSVQSFRWRLFDDNDTLLGSQIPFIQVRAIDLFPAIPAVAIRNTGTAVEIDFTELNTTSSYQLVRSADLEDGFPTIVDGPRNSAAASDTFTDSSPLPLRAFYRLEELP